LSESKRNMQISSKELRICIKIGKESGAGGDIAANGNWGRFCSGWKTKKEWDTKKKKPVAIRVSWGREKKNWRLFFNHIPSSTILGEEGGKKVKSFSGRKNGGRGQERRKARPIGLGRTKKGINKTCCFGPKRNGESFFIEEMEKRWAKMGGEKKEAF